MVPEVQELTAQEREVLAAAFRVMLMADGAITEEEGEALLKMAADAGFTHEGWERLWERASRAYPSTESVQEALAEIERERAREIVYEALYRLAEADEIDDREWDLLEWLDETWQGVR